RVEVAVIEVGLGGRFDATNVVHPAAAAITSIALDHEQYLGSTLEEIAFEKAGIVKPGSSVVFGEIPAPAAGVIRRAGVERGASVVPAAGGVQVTASFEEGRAIVSFVTPEDRYGPVMLALRGAHQVGNALVAVRLLEAARAAGI